MASCSLVAAFIQLPPLRKVEQTFICARKVLFLIGGGWFTVISGTYFFLPVLRQLRPICPVSFEIFSSISLRTICRCFDASDRRNFSSYISSLRRHVFVRSEEKFFQKENGQVQLDRKWSLLILAVMQLCGSKSNICCLL